MYNPSSNVNTYFNCLGNWEITTFSRIKYVLTKKEELFVWLVTVSGFLDTVIYLVDFETEFLSSQVGHHFHINIPERYYSCLLFLTHLVLTYYSFRLSCLKLQNVM